MRPLCWPLVRMTVKLSSVASRGSTRRVSACSALSDWMLPMNTATSGSRMKKITVRLATCSRSRTVGVDLNTRGSPSQGYTAIDEAHVDQRDGGDHQRQDEGRGRAHAEIV